MPRKSKPREPKKGRTISLSDEAMDVLKERKEAFGKKFGRNPGPGDPVFFDPDADTPKPLDADELQTAIIVAMRTATPRQYAASAFIAGLSATCASGTPLASQTNLVWYSASYADPSSTTALELTSQLGHRLGAGQGAHMTKQTAIHRIGNIILWLGTIFLVACMAASAGYAHYYLLGTLESPQSLLWVAGCLAALGIISWLVFASIAYIFNGRTPLAVICGRSRKANVSSLILVSFFSGGMLGLMIGIHYLFRTDLGPQLMFWFIWTIVWTFFIGRVAFEREQRLEQEQRLQQEQWLERQDWERRFPR